MKRLRYITLYENFTINEKSGVSDYVLKLGSAIHTIINHINRDIIFCIDFDKKVVNLYEDDLEQSKYETKLPKSFYKTGKIESDYLNGVGKIKPSKSITFGDLDLGDIGTGFDFDFLVVNYDESANRPNGQIGSAGYTKNVGRMFLKRNDLSIINHEVNHLLQLPKKGLMKPKINYLFEEMKAIVALEYYTSNDEISSNVSQTFSDLSKSEKNLKDRDVFLSELRKTSGYANLGYMKKYINQLEELGDSEIIDFMSKYNFYKKNNKSMFPSRLIKKAIKSGDYPLLSKEDARNYLDIKLRGYKKRTRVFQNKLGKLYQLFL